MPSNLNHVVTAGKRNRDRAVSVLYESNRMVFKGRIILILSTWGTLGLVIAMSFPRSIQQFIFLSHFRETRFSSREWNPYSRRMTAPASHNRDFQTKNKTGSKIGNARFFALERRNKNLKTALYIFIITKVHRFSFASVNKMSN